MKKLTIMMIAIICSLWHFQTLAVSVTTQISDLEKANIEALSQDEYIIGIMGTNWKTYRIECQKTVGVDYVIVVTKTTTYWKNACGYGLGWCLDSAGC